MALADLLVKINGDIAGLKTALGEANTALAGFGKKQEEAAARTAATAARQASIFEGSLRSFSNTATRVGSQLTLGFSLPMTLAGGAALKAAGEMEQANIAFKTMLGSAEKAKAMLTDLQQFALRTPFEFRDLQDAAKRLMALGFAAKDIIPVLTSVGDAVAALGGGKEMIDRVTLALGQMKAKGTIQAEEMRQLAEAGIPAWDILAKKLSVDIPTAMAMVEKRAVQSAEAIPAILAGMNEKFSGLMEMQSRTLLGQWSNLKDKLYMTAVEIGNNLMPIGKAALESLNPALAKVKELTEKFSELPDATKTAALGIGAVAVATPAAVWGLGLISGSLANIIGFAKSGAFGLWTTVVVGGLMQVALAAASAYINFKSVQDEWRAIRGQYPDLDKTLAGNASDMAARARARIESGIKLETSALFANQKGASGGISGDEWAALNDAYKASHLPFEERSAEANKLARSVQDAWKWEQMLRLEFEAFGADVPDVTAKIENLKDIWEPTFKQAPTQVEEIAEAFKTLGITSADEYQRIADVSKKAYDTIEKSGIGTMEEVTRAFLKSERDQIRAAEAKGIAVSESWKKMLDQIESDLDKSTSTTSEKTTKAIRSTETGLQKFRQQVSTIITDLSRDLADLIFQGGKFKDVMVNAAESFGKAILRAAIEAQLQRILGLFQSLTKEAGTLGKILGAVFGGGSSAASTATQTAGSAGGSAASGASSAAGSAAGGITGILGTVFSGISAATGVFSIFQNRRQETSLNAIEWNTRKSSLHLEHMLVEALNHWPGIDGLNSYNWDVQATYLQKICGAVESIDSRGGSSTQNITINVSGAGDPKSVAEQVIKALKMQSTVAAYA